MKLLEESDVNFDFTFFVSADNNPAIIDDILEAVAFQAKSTYRGFSVHQETGTGVFIREVKLPSPSENALIVLPARKISIMAARF